MKDYSELINLNDDFITNYYIEKNEIIIHYSNKKIKLEKYTEELEKEILAKMENQARKALDFKRKLENQMNNDIKISLTMFMLIIMHSLIFITGAASIITYISSSIILTLFLTGLNLIGKDKNKIKELKKIEYFFQNQLDLNKSTDLKKIKLSKKATKYIENKKVNFNINNIDNFSLSDLRKIKEFLDEEYPKKETTKQKVITFQKIH